MPEKNKENKKADNKKADFAPKPAEPMVFHPDPFNSELPAWVMSTGNCGILMQFFDYHKDELSENDKAYLKDKINVMMEVNMISENEKADIDAKAKNPKKEDLKSEKRQLYKKGNVVKLPNIHLDRFQTSTNGCWSVSYELMLQSKGIELKQEKIRSFRPEISYENRNMVYYDQYKRRNYKTSMNPYDNADLLLKVAPNTVMKELTYNVPSVAEGKTNGRPVTASEKKTFMNLYKRQVVNSLKERITEAIEGDRSTVSISYGGHFRTVVGINKKDGTIYFKDSIGSGDPDAEIKVKLSDIVNEYIVNPKIYDHPNMYHNGGIVISWAKDVPVPEKGKSVKLNDNISYDKDGKLVYTPTEENSSDMKSKLGSAKQGRLSGREITNNVHLDMTGQKFQVVGFGYNLQPVIAYENTYVPEQLYIPGKNLVKPAVREKYQPHEYELIEGKLFKLNSYKTDKKSSAALNETTVRSEDYYSIMYLEAKIEDDLKRTIKNCEEKLKNAGDDAEKERLSGDLAKLNEMQEKLSEERDRETFANPEMKLLSSMRYEADRRRGDKIKSFEEYKESVYRSLAYEMIKDRYTIRKEDTQMEADYKIATFGSCLTKEGFKRELEFAKSVVAGVGSTGNEDFKNIFEAKLLEQYNSEKKGDLLKNFHVEKKSDTPDKVQIKMMLAHSAAKLMDKVVDLPDVRRYNENVTVLGKIKMYDAVKSLSRTFGYLDKIDPKLQTGKQLVEEVIKAKYPAVQKDAKKGKKNGKAAEKKAKKTVTKTDAKGDKESKKSGTKGNTESTATVKKPTKGK